MKRLLVAVLLILPGAGLASEPGIRPAEVDEPAKTRKRPSPPVSFFAPKGRGPVLKLGYRTFSVSEMGERDSRYHLATLHVYLLSSHLRAGAGLEGGPESSHRKNFIIDGMLSLGVQYPAGVTPFLDAEMGIGFLRRDVLERDLMEFIYHGGIEGGIEIYAHESILVSASVGWRRQVFRHSGSPDVEPVYIYFDSLLLWMGFGF